MELEGEIAIGESQTEDRPPSQASLMFHCSTALSASQTAFQMDLHNHSRHSDNPHAVVVAPGLDECVDNNVSVHAILDNTRSCCSSSESLHSAATDSPSPDDEEDELQDETNNVESVHVSSSGNEQHTSPAGAVHHWSYEEQFRQLYNLSPETERKAFLDQLFSFMQKKGTPITRIPIMAKQPLDMYRLFKLVVERGGLVEVIKKKAWRDIAKELNLPASITSAAFTMRSQYVKYLYPFECEEKKLSDPKDLQLAIESNKRDRRHSDNVEFLPNSRDNDRRDTLTAVGHQVPFTVAGNPNALQLITSPTVAIPQTSLPPYSGGFIITPTPGGTHMVHAPRLTPGGPQLVQMGATHPNVPILVPTSVTGTPPSFTTMIPVKPEMLCSPTTVVPPREKKLDDSGHESSSPAWNNVPNLIHINHKASDSLVPTVILDRKHEDSHPDSDDEPPPAKRAAVESNNISSVPPINSSNTTAQQQALGMPFTNISIKPAMGGAGATETSPSVLVTLELNSTVYQGVLFARPRITSSPSR